MTARKAISKGSEITMDYSTLYAGGTKHGQSPCQCGESSCRGAWRSDDYQHQWYVCYSLIMLPLARIFVAAYVVCAYMMCVVCVF